MEQKLRDFVRTEIINRFLAKRSDYPYEDPKKLEELSQRVVVEMRDEMASHEPLKDVCALYALVDKVADRMADGFFLENGAKDSPDVPSPTEKLWEPLPTPLSCPDMWQQFPWDTLKDQPFSQDGLHGMVGNDFHEDLRRHRLSLDQDWMEDQESCGSIDGTKVDS